MARFCSCTCCVLTCFLLIFICEFGLAYQKRPIIGVLTQNNTNYGKYPYGRTYLLSSYVKYLEQAGAGVVPILVSQGEDYYNNLFNKINGCSTGSARATLTELWHIVFSSVLFPGGEVDAFDSPFAKVGRFFYEKAKQSNDNGDYFPLWGTCLGFELLADLTAGEDILERCHGTNIIMPLHFTSDFRKSRLFSKMSEEMISQLGQWNMTNNFHEYCVTSRVFNNNRKLRSFYKVLSSNIDTEGLKFVSTMEAYKYPFYAVQWHPEKNAFVYDVRQHINHSSNAIAMSQYFADFFVSEVRKNTHRFVNEKEEVAALIDNYHPIFFGYPNMYSAYFFNVSHPRVYSAQPSLNGLQSLDNKGWVSED